MSSQRYLYVNRSTLLTRSSFAVGVTVLLTIDVAEAQGSVGHSCNAEIHSCVHAHADVHTHAQTETNEYLHSNGTFARGQTACVHGMHSSALKAGKEITVNHFFIRFNLEEIFLVCCLNEH